MSKDLSPEFQRIHDEATVVDGHTDVIQGLFGTLDMFGKRKKFRILAEKSKEGHVDIPRLKEGGVDCQIFAIWSDPMRSYDATLRCMELLGHLLSEFEKNETSIHLATSYPEIMETIAAKKIAALLSLEGGEPINGKAGLLRLFYEMGVRLLGPTWSYRNQLAFGNREDPKYGFSEAGFEVIKEAERLGIILDVSHLNEQSFYDLAGSTSKPFIASHSNAKALWDHPRNLDDKQIRLLADRGGAIGINFNPPFLGKEVGVDTVCKQIKYITNLVGSEHVGLGSDYDGIETTPVGLEDISKLPAITKKLAEDGMSKVDLENVLGQSFLRVFKSVLS
ncbi:MAG: dipeptidase [Thaumarchaeota archaeon]|nr:dipeptidase [Nitrososphaerota archaeon]